MNERIERGEGQVAVQQRASKAGWLLRGVLAAGLVLGGCVSGPASKPTVAEVDTDAPPPEPTVEERMDEAMGPFRAGKWADARERFDVVLSKEPGHAEANFYKGWTYEVEGRFDEAAEAYRKTLETAPTHEGSLLNLGYILRRREQFNEAIELYTKALEVEPENVKIRNNLGVSYRLAGRYDDAEKTLRRVLARRPGNVDAYKNMAAVFYERDRLDLAQQFLVEAQKLADNKDAGIFNNLGLIYHRRDDGRPARALGAFRRAVQLDPKLTPAHLNIGSIALAYRDYARAQESFSRVIELDPNGWEGHLALGYARSGARKCKEALESFDRVLALRGDYHDAVFGKAQCFKQLRDWENAKITFEKYTGMEGATRVADAEAEIRTAAIMIESLKPQTPTAPEEGIGAAPAPEVAPAEPVPAPISPEPGADAARSEEFFKAFEEEAPSAEEAPAPESADSVDDPAGATGANTNEESPVDVPAASAETP